MKLVLFLILFSFSALAANPPGLLTEYNYQVTDLAKKGLNLQKIFDKMERNLFDTVNSICADRAHIWAYDLERFYGIKTGKIFLFFGASVWEGTGEGWMYHVSNYVINNGKEFILEASYSDVKSPMQFGAWVANETYGKLKGTECIEITSADTDLTEYFYQRYNLPEKREKGKKSARCYYRKVPGYYQYPVSIAYHDLQRDSSGNDIEFDPKSYDYGDVLSACIEAASTTFSRYMSGPTNKCTAYLND